MMHQPALPDPQKGEKLTKNVTKMGWQCCFSRGITDESAQSSAHIGYHQLASFDNLRPVFGTQYQFDNQIGIGIQISQA
jgi:hypothetical protein